jgi:death-on-curing protein
MPDWIVLSVALAIHDEQLAEHGGSAGLRDRGLIESALDRPKNLLAYGNPGPPDIADLASAYACGIAQNHAFVDGNKRTSNVITLTFLELNGYELTADEAEQIDAWRKIAEGTMSDSEFTAWLRTNIKVIE